MFPIRPNKTRPFLITASGFTLGQLLAALVIINVIAFFVFCFYSVLQQANSYARRGQCTRNLKQVSLALLQYAADYDERFPPCAQPTATPTYFSGWAASHDTQGKNLVTDLTGADWSPKNPAPNGLIYPYAKTMSVFRCPSTAATVPVSYMFNDLAAGVAQKDFAAPQNTVLVCDGENVAGNVGHAYNPYTAPAAPYFSRKGAVASGAVLQTAPTRHSGRAAYAFADGHVKFGAPKRIYFPPRRFNNPSHIDKRTGDPLGPDPAKLDATGYMGTFHVK